MRTENSWQKMETAPKDGREILIWSKDWDGCVVSFYDKEKEDWVDSTDGEAELWPTHWMSLPEKPGEEE